MINMPDLQNINVTILPVIIIPVTGICCLVFYNRLASLNSLIHTITKDLLNCYIGTGLHITEKQKAQLKSTYRLEQTKLLHRSNLIRWAIVSCFIGLLAFILSAISIILSTYWPNVVIATLILWGFGALSFTLGLITGLFELKAPTLQNITMIIGLIDDWEQQSMTLKGE